MYIVGYLDGRCAGKILPFPKANGTALIQVHAGKQDVYKRQPQGYSALALHPECVRDEPSVLLADIGGWTVDLMRLDNSVPNAATCRSLELGVIRCVDVYKRQVSARSF